MGAMQQDGLDVACLQHIFSFLSPNYLVLLVKPLSKHFKGYVEHARGHKAKHVDALSDVPPWALSSMGIGSLGSPQQMDLITAAARRGCLHTLDWAKSRGLNLRYLHVSDSAAAGGHLAALQWLREEECPWGPSTCEVAARRGHVEVVLWALQNGCPSDRTLCSAAAACGNLQLLQIAREHGCEWDSSTCEAAAAGGHLEVLKWVREEGCLWDEACMCPCAAEGGSLEVLQWVREQGCPWGPATCAKAAAAGHLGILQWLREHGCAWNALTCLAAARGGDLATLQWAREHGCDWHERTCSVAANAGHLELLQWAVASGNGGAAAAAHVPAAAAAAAANVAAAAAAGHAGGAGADDLYGSGSVYSLDLTVVDWEGGVLAFKLMPTFRMGKVMSVFCTKKGIREDEVRFVFAGVPVEACLTSDEHGMVDDDQLDVIREVAG